MSMSMSEKQCQPQHESQSHSKTTAVSILMFVLSASTAVLIEVTSSTLKRRKRRVIPNHGNSNPHNDNKNATENNNSCTMDVHVKDTPRNRQLLRDASGNLLSEPWGVRNKHLACVLAQLRPSPFWGSWGSLVTRRREKIGELMVEFIEPLGVPTMRQEEQDDILPGTAHRNRNVKRNYTYNRNRIPIIIVMHGVNGNSREPYIEQAALQIAIQNRWRALVWNYTNLRPHTNNATLLSGGSNFVDGADLHFLVSHLRHVRGHDGFIGLLGYSMGGAKLLHYLGRTREHCNIDAACTISSPLDFTPKNATVYNPVTLEQRAYHLLIASSLKLWLLKNYYPLSTHPALQNAKPFRRTKSGLLWWLQANKVTDIDHAVTYRAKGYGTLDEYYQDASGLERLRKDVRVPFLCITARNDPFVPHDILPQWDLAQENENVFIVDTKDVGSHVGYWLPGKGCWATRSSLAFFESVRKNTRHVERQRPLYIRKQSSIAAAHYLAKSSTTKLTDYAKVLPFDHDDDGFDCRDDYVTAAATTTRSKTRENPACAYTEEKDAVYKTNHYVHMDTYRSNGNGRAASRTMASQTRARTMSAQQSYAAVEQGSMEEEKSSFYYLVRHRYAVEYHEGGEENMRGVENRVGAGGSSAGGAAKLFPRRRTTTANETWDYTHTLRHGTGGGFMDSGRSQSLVQMTH